MGHYGMTEGYWGVIVEGTLGNRLPGYAYPLSGKAEAVMRHFPITELETKYPIIGTYSKPYGGFTIWDSVVGGDQFVPYVWEDRYLIGDGGLHIIQVVCVRSDNDEVEFDVRMDPLGVSTIPNDNDEFFCLGTKMQSVVSNTNNYPYVFGVGTVNSMLYLVSGGMPDWTYNSFGALSYLYELRPHKPLCGWPGAPDVGFVLLLPLDAAAHALPPLLGVPAPVPPANPPTVRAVGSDCVPGFRRHRCVESLAPAVSLRGP